MRSLNRNRIRNLELAMQIENKEYNLLLFIRKYNLSYVYL